MTSSPTNDYPNGETNSIQDSAESEQESTVTQQNKQKEIDDEFDYILKVNP